MEAGKRALAVDQSAASHSLLGQAYLAQKDFAHGVEELSAALKLNPYSEDSYFRLSQAYLVQLDYDHAIAVLQSARKTFDKSAQIELALGVAYYGQRKFPEAVEQFLRTIRIAPDVPQPYVFLDRMLDHAGDRLNEITALMAEFENREGSFAHPARPRVRQIVLALVDFGRERCGDGPGRAPTCRR